MRRVDLLITSSRRATENENFTETSGISDEEFLQYINDGQDEIQSIIFNSFPELLTEETTINAVKGQEAYSIPFDAFLGNRVETVEYSATGRLDDYRLLKKGSQRERISGIEAVPAFYIRRSGKILIQPQPDDLSGVIRLVYQKRVARLDKRRATVGAVTLNSSTNKITSLTLDTSVLLDSDALSEEEEITIVDRQGNQQMRRILITDVNSTTGVVTVDSSFTYEEFESISVGDYVLRGPDSTTHSDLPEITEKYLTEYMNLRILLRDSSNDSGSIANLLSKVETTIREAFAQPDAEVQYPAILDSQYLETDTDV